jgi:hypothetical protein
LISILPIRTSYSSSTGFLDEIMQAVFKIEVELAIMLGGACVYLYAEVSFGS